MWNVDPERSIDEILADIKTGAVRSFNPQSTNSSFVLAPLAALLVKLSMEAASREKLANDLAIRLNTESEATAQSVNEKTQTLISLTSKLIFWTRIIVILTILLLISEGLHFFSATTSQKHEGNVTISNQPPQTQDERAATQPTTANGFYWIVEPSPKNK